MLSLTLALMTPDAAACGGFFCNRTEPVKQKGETIVFDIDKDEDKTTMHVQVEYAGPAAEFAWVIPVKGTPDLALSHEKLFSELEIRTRPAFQLYGQWDGTCWDFGMYPGGIDTDADGISSDPDDDGVEVLATSQVGPYDTVVVAADNEADLLTWLQANNYTVPDAMGPVLAPYLADGHNFVALRLSSGNDVGDLEPLAMTYGGTQPAIPLHLTKIAAEEDMPMTAFVLGEARAVPDNYLHVEVNLAAIDWFQNGNNYDGLITRAADQAGGHAFATDYSGATESWENTFYDPSYDDLTIHEATGAQDFVNRVITSGLPGTSELRSILQAHVPVPADFNEQSVYNSPNSYPIDEWHPDFDVAAAWADIDATILQPLADIQEMFDRQQHLTRLRSSISPAEMTLDPMFAINPEIKQTVDRVRQAVLTTKCDPSVQDWNEYTRTLTLPNGEVIELPTQRWLWDHNLNESTWLARMQEPAASKIEDLSDGPSQLIYDGSSEISEQIRELNDQVGAIEGRSSRGCNVATGLGLGWFALVLPIVARRR